MTYRILLTSESKIKLKSLNDFLVSEFLSYFEIPFNITTINCEKCLLPEQPYGTVETIMCFAEKRINYVKTLTKLDEYDYVISIESGIDNNEDKCTTLILHKGLLASGCSYGIEVDKKYIEKLTGENNLINYNRKILGYKTTIGELIQKDHPDIDPKNWMSILGKNREDQIKDSLENCFNNLDSQMEIKENILKGYKTYLDYPKKGVIFHDIFPVLKNGFLFGLLNKLLFARYQFDDIDYIIGLESRGFCIGSVLAHQLDIGFIPIRKEGKLPGVFLPKTSSLPDMKQSETLLGFQRNPSILNTPGAVIRESYKKEYGEDICEIQTDIPSGSKVVIIDDLIATGGSMEAAVNLLTRLNCVVVDCCVLREVPELREIYSKKVMCNILLQ